LEPDEDETPFDSTELENVLLVEALMGWDGDPCECACKCRRFRDASPDPRCEPCRRGEHWTTDGH
jgi:hypothetical protein